MFFKYSKKIERTGKKQKAKSKHKHIGTKSVKDQENKKEQIHDKSNLPLLIKLASS